MTQLVRPVAQLVAFRARPVAQLRAITTLLALLLWVAPIGVQHASAQQSRVVIDDFAVGQWVTRNMQALNIPSIAVGIVGADREYYLEAFGPTDLSEPYLIGSLSQSVTALAVMLLVEDGVVTLQEPASKWVSAVPEQVTLEHLLYQTSGLPQDHGAQLWTALDQSVEQLVEAANFAPTGTFAYAHLNYAILGEVVTKASGKPYADFVQERIFAPAKMTSSSAATTPPDTRAEGHQYLFGFPQPSGEPAYSAAMVPASFVWMSGHDMVRWIRLFVARGKLDGEQRFPAHLFDKMLSSPDVSGYAMGWMVSSDGTPVPVAKHHGATAAFAAAMAVAPEREFGAFVLTNVNSWLALSTMTILEGVITPVLGMAPGSSTNLEFLVRLGLGFLLAITLLTLVFETMRWIRNGFPLRLSRREALGAVAIVGGNIFVLVMVTQFWGMPVGALVTTQPDVAYAFLGAIGASTVRQFITGFNKTAHQRALSGDT